MGKRVLFGKLRVYIGHRCCATIGVWLFLIFVAHYKIVRRERSISGLRAGIKIPVGLRNAPAGAVTVPGPHGGCHNAICRKAQRRPGGWPPYCGAGFHIKFMICSKAKAHGTMQASSPTNGFLGSQPLTAGSGDPALLGYTHFSTCDWAGVLRFLHYYTTHLPKKPAAAKRSRGPCMLVDSHAAAITSSCGRYEQ